MMKASRGKSGKSQSEATHERISDKASEAASAVLDLITSIGANIEQRIGLEDQIKNISKEADSLLDRVDDLTKANQKKLLLAYRHFLKRNIEAVDQKLKE
jgi:hypothetical protein